MLNNIIRFSLNHRIFVIAFVAFLVVYGVSIAVKLPVDIFPDITKPTITIMTEAHGMAPEEVEARVTVPVESFLNGVGGIDRIRSQSGVGLSVIIIEFQWGTDLYRNRQLIQEKLNLAKEKLPSDVAPVMGPIGSLMGQIQQIAVTSNSSVDPIKLRSLADWVIRPRLLAISGVSQVIAIGGGVKQYQILISAEKLNRFQITMDQVYKELTQISQNTTGGFLEKEGNEYLIRNIGVVNNIDDIKKTLVGLHFGRPVLLSDIADVKIDHRLKRGEGSFNASPAVIMTIQKQPGADTVQITKNVDKVIKELEMALPPGVVVNPNVFKQAEFIQTSIDGIQNKLKLGTVLVFIVLFLFLANLRMSVITLTAIPLSFIVSVLVFKLFGLSINTMTLGGLAIAIGELVDDSIVDVENVYRRLRENAIKKDPLSILNVIFQASSEIRNSIVLATIIIALVFLPLFQLSGLEGKLFTPLAIAYLTSLIASLLVSLTVTPVLCSYFLTGKMQNHSDTRFVRMLKKSDERILKHILEKPNIIILFFLIILVSSFSLIRWMGTDFLPKFNEGTAMLSVVAKPGISLNESNELALKAEKILLEQSEIKSVSRRTGRAELDEHAEGVNVSEMDIDFVKKGDDREAIFSRIRERFKSELPMVSVTIGQPVSHLIDHMLSGVNAAIAIKIFGSDLTELKRKALEIKNTISTIHGLVDLRIEQQGLVPQIKIFILRTEAAKFGLSSGEITKLLEAAFNGQVVAQITEDSSLIDVFFQFDLNSKGSMQKMQNTVLKIMPDGKRVLLNDVADVYEATGPNVIHRENGQRRIVISANVSDRDLGGVIADLTKTIEQKIKFKEGYFIKLGGQFESQQTASRNIIIFGLIALLGIGAVLYSHFKSFSIVIQIMTTIPLAFSGGLVLLFLTDRTITVASLIGFVTLCGVASRNSIMMISHYLHLAKFENCSFNKQMIIKGSLERLVPVLMTAFVTSLALFPLVLAKGQPGSEILHPVAVVIVGGLISSTLLDVIVTPVLFYRFGKKSVESYLKKENEYIS